MTTKTEKPSIEPTPERPTNRAVSEVIGAVLIFGILILLLVVVQVFFIPVANEQVEYEHSQRIQGDLLEFANQAERLVAAGQSGSTALELTAHYPGRVIFLNPPPASGTFESTRTGTISIENAVAPSASVHWDGGTDQEYETTTYRYRPDYNLYDEAPTTYFEHGALVNAFPSGEDLPLDTSALIDGKTITITTVEGQLSRSSATPYVVPTAPLSAPAESMTIQSQGGNPIELTLPTSLSEAAWDRVLSTELDGGNVIDATVTNGVLEVQLEPGTYDLRMARMGVGPAASRPRATADYIDTTEQVYGSIRYTETQRVAVDIRDVFNNPANASVTFSSPNGNFVVDGQTQTTATVVSGSDGEAAAVFDPTTGFTGTATITVQGDLDSSGGNLEPRETREIEIDVTSPTDVDEALFEGLSSINPVQPVQLTDITRLSPSEVRLRFKNNDDIQHTMTQARFSYYYPNQNNAATNLKIDGGTYPLFEDFRPVSNGIQLDPGESETVVIESNGGPVQGDIFGLSIKWTDPYRGTYFVAVG